MPNLVIALRIFLSLPVSIAEGERKFSGLKRLKDDKRSSTSQNKLNDEAMIYFNPDLTKSLILNEVIDEFVDIKVRKMIS